MDGRTASTMIVCCFKNIKTGITYTDLLSTRDIKKLIANPNIVMKDIKWKTVKNTKSHGIQN